MKKMVALACAGLMVASVVTGCGSKKDDADKSGGEKRVLKFDSFSGGNGEEVWKDLEAAFEKKYPEVDVQMRFEKDLPAVLNKENATGTYSDLVYYNVGQKSGFTESQLNSGEVMDISDVFANAKDVDQAFADSSVSKYLGDGKNLSLIHIQMCIRDRYFKDLGIDAVVGSVGNGTTLRLISDIPGVKYTEGRFLPYFFPDVFCEGGDPIQEAKVNWVTARRAILRSPLDRIGYGGYLKLALQFPDFVRCV